MLKYISFLFLFFSVPFCFSQDLKATLNMPEVISPGEDYTVEVNIVKGEINSYIKFLQKLPPNFSASKLDVNGGNFSFLDSVVKIVWLFPPASEEFSFSYKVHVPDSLTGDEMVAGKIFYFFNTNRESFSFQKRYLDGSKGDTDTDTVFITKTIVQRKDTILLDNKLFAEKIAPLDSLVNDSLNSNFNVKVDEKVANDSIANESTPAIVDEKSAPLNSLKGDSVNNTLNKEAMEAVGKNSLMNDTTNYAQLRSDSIGKELEDTVRLNSEIVKVDQSTKTEQASIEVAAVNPLKSESKKPVSGGERLYGIQIGAFREDIPLETANKFLTVSARGIKNLKENNGITTYIVGEFTTYEEAIEPKKELLAKGFNGSYIIAYENKGHSAIKKAVVESNKVEKAKVVETLVVKESTQIENQQKLNPEKISTANKTSIGSDKQSLKTYQIQLGAFKEEVPLELANKFINLGARGIKNLKDERGYTTYTVGDFSTRSEADNLRQLMVEKGFTDAYVITFENGKILK